MEWTISLPDRNFSLGIPGSFNPDLRVCLFFDLLELLSPLDEQDAARFRAQIIYPERHQFSIGVDSIEVDMKQRDSGSAIFVNEGECRAGHILLQRRPEPFCHALHQRRLPCSEIAAQDDQLARDDGAGKLPADGNGLV